MEDFMSEWARLEAARREAVKQQKDALITVLRDNGIKYAVVSYSGYGDSGQIEEIAVYGPDATKAPEDCYDGEGKIDIPDVIVTLPEEEGKNLKGVLEDYGWEVAYSMNPGFENNEGGQGTVVIDVEQGTVSNNHGTNITHIEYSSAEF